MKRLIYMLMTALGFGAVSCEGGGNLDAYGTPYLEYRISARVVDSEGNPIRNIKVGASKSEELPTNLWNTTTTDDDGRFELSGRDRMTLPVLRFEDVDGELNGGEFETLTLDISDSYTHTEEGKGWSNGSFEASLDDIVLNEKQ